MKNIYIAISMALLCGATAISAPLTPEQALARLNSSQAGGPHRIQAAHAQLAYTQKSADRPAVYIFNRGGDNGFLVLPADDNTVSILGYSDTGKIESDPAQYPPAFRYWIEKLGEQVALNARNNVSPVPAKVVGSAIAPMVATRWNQDAPFYDDCPKVGDKYCYTGCVATALSQILNYHQYPVNGTGTHSYVWGKSSTSAGDTLTYDYSKSNFQWAEMLDKYDTTSSDASKAAVANLMYACGVAVDMGYGTDESGASTVHLPHALVTYFNYDKGARIYLRDYYGIDEWNRMVYDQLKTYGPIQYSGQSNQGGHSFVCDGYSSDGYFHINWGWGGMSDGYYLLTALDPGEQGIGGSTSGYNFDQDIIGNVSTTQTSTEIYPNVYWGGDFEVSTNSVTLGSDITVSGNAYSYGADTLKDLTFGVKVTPTDGGTPVFLRGASGVTLPLSYGISQYDVKIPSDLAAGTYKLTPVVRMGTGEWHEIPVKVSANRYYTMTVEGDTATFTPEGEAGIKVTDFVNATPLYIGAECEIKATLQNPTENEYLGTLNVILVSSDGNETIVGGGENVAVDVPAGTTQQFAYITELNANSGETLTAGTYYLYLAAQAGNGYEPIAGPLTVTLNAESDPTFKVTEFEVPETQDKENIEASAVITLTEGYFYGQLKLALGRADKLAIDHWITTDYITMYQDSSSVSASSLRMDGEGTTVSLENSNIAKVSFSGAYDTATPGDKYFAVLFAGSKQLNYPTYFTIDIESGVREVEMRVVNRDYYTLTGVKMIGEPTGKGLYIVRTQYEDGRVETSRVIR